MTPPENSKLLVISFDDPLRAQEFLLAGGPPAAGRRPAAARRGDHRRDGGRELARPRDHRCHAGPGRRRRGRVGAAAGHAVRRTDRRAGRRRGQSAGGGALFAKLVDTGVKDETVAELRTPCRPGAPRWPCSSATSRWPTCSGNWPASRHGARRDRPASGRGVGVQEALAEANRQPFTDASGWSPPTGPADPSGTASPSAQS